MISRISLIITIVHLEIDIYPDLFFLNYEVSIRIMTF